MNRSIAALAFVPLLGGCYLDEVVLDRARMESDVPVPPPAMVPDSARAGSVHGQIALWTMNAADSVGPRMRWSRSPVGAQGQLQVVVGPHLRWVFGAGGSRTASGWVGPVASLRNSLVRWDFELLMGLTYYRSRLEGHVPHERDGVVVAVDSVRDTRSGFGTWGQWTMRCRAVRSGPWVEWRVLPSFYWGELDSPEGGSRPARVGSTMGSLGAGWVQETRSGTLWYLGARAIGIENEAFPQFLLSWQRPIRLGSQ